MDDDPARRSPAKSLDAVVWKRAAQELKVREANVEISRVIHVEVLKRLPLHHSSHDQARSSMEAESWLRQHKILFFERILHGEDGAPVVNSTAVGELFFC